MSNYGYDLDQQSARSAESIGKYIRETGKYLGKFTRAELMFSQKTGARGIELDFLSDDGKECTTQLWTHNGAGDPLPAINMVNALMTCLGLRGIKPVRTSVPKYDYDAKAKVKADVDAFPDLMNKPIGLLLQKEISTYEGKDKTKMLIYAAFQHGTEKTASEILDRVAAPSALGKLLAGLADKDSRGKGGKGQQSGAHTRQQSGSQHNAAPDFDDDLPF